MGEVCSKISGEDKKDKDKKAGKSTNSGKKKVGRDASAKEVEAVMKKQVDHDAGGKEEPDKVADHVGASNKVVALPCFGTSDEVQNFATERHDPSAWRLAMEQAGDGKPDANMVQIRFLRQLIWEQTFAEVEKGLKSDGTSNHLRLASNAKTEKVSVSSSPNASTGSMPRVFVKSVDMLCAAQDLHLQGKKVAVLNMAAASSPGGGVRHGAGAQEENLHRRSDAYRFTMGCDHYPIPETACLVSDGVTALRGPESDSYPWLPETFQFTLLSCAALRKPALTEDRKYRKNQESESMALRIAATIEGAERSNCSAVVLSAFGCGAFGNPPEEVALMFKNRLANSKLEEVIFSIIEDHNSNHWHNPNGNYKPFLEVFS